MAGKQLLLYSYFRSSCAARVRVALELKSIQYETAHVNLNNGGHLERSYTTINPSASVPTLQIQDESGTHIITQSVAGLEYLEEAFPGTICLLPETSDIMGRATVRSLVNIIANDTQPVTNSRIQKAVSELGGDAEQWTRNYFARGLTAYEAVVEKTAGVYSYKDTITLADVCLVPAVWNCERWGSDMSRFPTVNRIYAKLSEHPAIKAAHWKNQKDCPEELK